MPLSALLMLLGAEHAQVNCVAYHRICCQHLACVALQTQSHLAVFEQGRVTLFVGYIAASEWCSMETLYPMLLYGFLYFYTSSVKGMPIDYVAADGLRYRE
ncbi:hypothetical protein K450DRAFT_264182 [Umbelopsis ramanniana AG]|uniref:Secreted protein n=1 Tax=Umbelopsis ramanniana AG TaxID=1314678 RepID=A0AAD5E0G3_UMBRA|nr:uncharacterized protein K450DRAFT_264182 [Umbelopsis ramanniana AG]KAI8574882.1 hypothetical protein K450DRAFT_264182 [Umbelopsis ramanniana AG]